MVKTAKAFTRRAALLCALTITSTAGATLVRHVDLEEQALSAEIVVVAVAREQSCAYGGNTGLIFTTTSFEVERWVKGSGGATVTSRQIGGVVGDMGQSVAGSPVFRTGNRYVLFLESGSDGVYRVVGFSQGAYPVVKSAGGKVKVMPSLASASGVELVGGSGSSVAGARPLEEFLATVRSYLGEE